MSGYPMFGLILGIFRLNLEEVRRELPGGSIAPDMLQESEVRREYYAFFRIPQSHAAGVFPSAFLNTRKNVERERNPHSA